MAEKIKGFGPSTHCLYIGAEAVYLFWTLMEWAHCAFPAMWQGRRIDLLSLKWSCSPSVSQGQVEGRAGETSYPPFWPITAMNHGGPWNNV